MKNLLKLKNLYTLIFIAVLAYGGYYFGTQNTEDNTSSKTLELTTISIQKGDLAKKEEYNGTLRQTDKKILNSPTNGVVTFLPKEGSIVNFGEVLFIIDNKPVILLQGNTPFYRTLDLNSDPGVDIKQVEEALMQEMETAFKEFGIEAKISSVANAQTIGTGLLELPIQVRGTKEVHHDD